MQRRVLVPITLVAVLIAGCGDDDDATTTTAAAATTAADAATTAAPATTAAESPDTTDSAATDTTAADAPATTEAMSMATEYPLTIDNCGYELTFDAPPEQVLILNGTSVAEVETFIALGIEDAILANSQTYGQSDIDGMVEQIAALPTGGLTLNENFEVPKEQTLALEPDLVISTWAGGFSEMMGSVTRDELAGVGIQSWVTPVNCAYGNEAPRPEDQERSDAQTYLESFEMVRELGVIFDVQERAEAFIAEAQATIDAVEQPTGEPASVLLAYPGMSMMNAAGIPQVFAGPFTDSVIEAAGGVNSFDGLPSFNDSALITAEQLAAADVDVLAVGVFLPGEDAELYAKDIFAQFPQWEAAKNNAWISIAESFYLGPYNSVGIQKLADAIAALG
ncbi:MAG: ABC transporter substrate-binding protein [Acidimicrobiales bacterium]|nr:ABC transporter substrate-binding protein [Acidimicrobiales bacterium]MCB9395852.1 ABC transporter substrate-binding protein [Acidimicrobiaceae bacterium]